MLMHNIPCYLHLSSAHLVFYFTKHTRTRCAPSFYVPLKFPLSSLELKRENPVTSYTRRHKLISAAQKMGEKAFIEFRLSDFVTIVFHVGHQMQDARGHMMVHFCHSVRQMLPNEAYLHFVPFCKIARVHCC